MYCVYVLKSLKDGRFYKGMTDNLERRIDDHFRGKVLSTRHRRPLVLVYTEQCKTRAQARRREKFLKSGPGQRFLISVLEAKV
ncbi:MAG: GIY-YIG nuclease family protein [Bacteroidota bacterium]